MPTNLWELHTIPGYSLPTKNWDVVIVQEQRLLAVLELKSQVGSFGNNFNNRTEEVQGNATDFITAARKDTYQPENHTALANSGLLLRDGESETCGNSSAPLIGYLLLLEDCPDSTTPLGIVSPHFHMSEGFIDSPYARRCQLLCERLMEQRLIDAAGLLLSPALEGASKGTHRSLCEATSATSFFAALAGRLLAVATTSSTGS